MTEEQVIDLMRSSKSEGEWNFNCEKVKQACGGYPEFWYKSIILSGLCNETSKNWGGSNAINIDLAD
jgi:hypothetical protein